MLSFIATIPLAVFVAAIPTPPTKLGMAAVAAYHDAMSLPVPAKEKYFYRYIYWPEGWNHTALLTKSGQALLSTKGYFPTPVRVKGTLDLYRIDVRQGGWEKRLDVWERFADIDFVFHMKLKLLEDRVFTFYYPQGYYDGKWHSASYAEVKVKAGQTINAPAMWANPEIIKDVKGEKGLSRVKITKKGVLDELRRILYTEVPIVFGPWWLVRTARQIDLDNQNHNVGYYNWFGVKNRKDVYNLVGINEDEAFNTFQDYRAWVKSDVSEQERQIVLIRARTGWAWITLDVFTQRGRGQPGRNLRRKEFAHDAEEGIVPLPNGLPFNYLVAAKDNAKLGIKAGDLQDSAPDALGSDTSTINQTRDRRIHNGDVCWNCHGLNKDYIRPFEDLVRLKFQRDRAFLLDKDKVVLEEELKSSYLRDINRLVDQSRRDFAFAVASLTSTGEKDPGLTVAGFTRIYKGAIYQYILPVDVDDQNRKGVTLEIASMELGVDPKVFLDGLWKYNDKVKGRGLSDIILSEFMDGRTISRLAWEDSFQAGMMIALGLQIPEIVNKVKPFTGKEE